MQPSCRTRPDIRRASDTAIVLRALLVAADVPVRIVSGPGRDTTDWILVCVAVASAVATVGAVLVALFGPDWRAKNRAPSITLTGEPEFAGSVDLEDELPQIYDGLSVQLLNKRGRHTAHGVEVFITASYYDKMLDFDFHQVTARNLNFDSPLDGHYGRAVATVPSGFVRPIYIASVGVPEMLFDRHYPGSVPLTDLDSGPSFAVWALTPARQDEIQFLTEETEYTVELVITGENFDAVRYLGKLTYAKSSMDELVSDPDDEEPEYAPSATRFMIRLRWSEALTPVAPRSRRARR